ncbi:MAG: DNA-formamidopyrimidine glycosylase [bacterium]|nr:DNA-formamidopyrimidine glycosylase [bacterium]
MPELPEVETIKRYLQRAIVGKTIIGVEILSKKQFPDNPKEVIGVKIISIARRGKNLIINLSNNKSLLIHLKLTGQLVVTQKNPDRATRVIVSFNQGKLFFNDLRKFGWMKIVKSSELELTKLGPEPFWPDFTNEYLKQVFSKTTKPIKLVLLDQEKIAGIGNIYANDALWEAEIYPERPAKNLRPMEIKKLREAIILVLKEGILYEGSSAADGAYIKPDTSPGSYQKHFRVYQKDGEKCQKCGTIIKRINLGGRGTFFCPSCQTPSLNTKYGNVAQSDNRRDAGKARN